MRSVEVLLVLPEIRVPRIAGTQLGAEVKLAGYNVEVWCSGWGRRPDGSVEIDFRGTLRSPPDVVERLPIR